MARRREGGRVKIVKRRDKEFLVLRWKDPETGRTRERQTSTRRRREAERDAADLESEIADGLVDSGDILWDAFRVRYEAEHLAGCSAKYRSQCTTAFNTLERLHGPQIVRLGNVTASLLSRFAAAMRDEGKPPTTAAAYLRPIRSALNWAERIGLLHSAPAVGMPRRARGISKHMRSRPITLEEFERIIIATPKVRTRDAARWERFLHGLWESGLRVGELLSLTWEPEGLLSVAANHAIPLLMIRAEGQQKKHVDQFQPITPEFWRLIEVPAPQRRGFVFPLPGRSGGQMTVGRVIRTISNIGRKAGVVTESTSSKCATSHDIGRRPFTVRMGRRLSQAELAEWMRHRSPQTTMQYYHAIKAEELAARVWRKGDLTGDPRVTADCDVSSSDIVS